MKVLVTGGAGFIGSHLVHALCQRGDQVRVFDNLSSGKLENIADITDDIEFIHGDVKNYDQLVKAAADCDLIYHQAALVSVPASIKDPRLNQASNIVGTANMLEAARVNDVKRVVYASSAAVYGDSPKLPKQEDDQPAPISPYAAAKLAGEILLSSYTRTYGLETVSLRYMNVFGPRQDPSSPYSGVLSIFTQSAMGDGKCKVFGDGKQTRDFVFVSDVVQANLLAGSKPYSELPQPAVYNVGRGEETSLNQIISRLGVIRGEALDVEYKPSREGDIRFSVADISRSKRYLGYCPSVDIQRGLQDTMEWVKRSKNG